MSAAVVVLQLKHKKSTEPQALFYRKELSPESAELTSLIFKFLRELCLNPQALEHYPIGGTLGRKKA